MVQQHWDCLVHHLDDNGIQLCTTWNYTIHSSGYLCTSLLEVSHWLWAILYTLKEVDKSALEGEWMDVGMNIFIYKMNGLAIKNSPFLAGHPFFFSRLWLQFVRKFFFIHCC